MNTGLARVDQEIRESCHVQPFSSASEWRERPGLPLVSSDWRADYRLPKMARRDAPSVVPPVDHETACGYVQTSERTALSREKRYRLAADSIRSWLAEDDDEDIVILAELEQHLKLNPVGLQE